MIKADYPRDEVVEQRVEIDEVKEDDKDNHLFRSEVSRAASSLEQEVLRSGRSVCQTMPYNPTTGKATELSAEQNHGTYLAELYNEELIDTIEVDTLYLELGSVCAGLGGGFTNTNELKVMKYQETVNGPVGECRREETVNKHNIMLVNSVFDTVGKECIPLITKIIDSTWSCTLNINGTKCGRLNACGFRLVDDQSYNSENMHAPVTNNVTIRLVMVLMLMSGLVAHIVDVKGAYLHEKIEEGEKVYMKVTEGWEHFYLSSAILLLLRTIYVLKQAAITLG